MDLSAAAVVLAASFLASVAQGLTGFGFALVVVPFVVLVLDVQDAVVIATLLGMVSLALLVLRVYRDVPWALVWRLLAGSAAGMPAGLVALLLVPDEALRVAVGLVVVVMAALLAAGARVELRSSPRDLAVGLISGVLRTSTALAGPPVVLYLQGSGSPPYEFRAALTVFFLIGSVVSLAAFAGAGVVHGNALVLSAVAVPAVGIGNVAGNRLLGLVDPLLFGRIVLALLIATSLAAVGTSLARLAG